MIDSRLDTSVDDESVVINTLPMGAGDGTIIKCRQSRSITIIDMGTTNEKNGPGLDEKNVILALDILMDSNWNLLENIFLTHSDSDHVSFVDRILKKLAEEANGKIVNFYIGDRLGDYNDKVDFGNHNVYQPQGTNSVTQQPIGITCGGWYNKGNNEFASCTWTRTRNPTKTTNNSSTSDASEDYDADEDSSFLTSSIGLCLNTWSLNLMAANFGERYPTSSRNESGSYGGTRPNMNSLVMKLTPTGLTSPSMLFMGDFENIDSIWPNSNYEYLIDAANTFYKTDARAPVELRNGLMSDVFMLPHHGTNTNGNGNAQFFREVFPATVLRAYSIVSGGRASPRCSTLRNLKQTYPGISRQDYQQKQCYDEDTIRLVKGNFPFADLDNIQFAFYQTYDLEEIDNRGTWNDWCIITSMYRNNDVGFRKNFISECFNEG